MQPSDSETHRLHRARLRAAVLACEHHARATFLLTSTDLSSDDISDEEFDAVRRVTAGGEAAADAHVQLNDVYVPSCMMIWRAEFHIFASCISKAELKKKQRIGDAPRITSDTSMRSIC
eukprot:gnl/TRDRNA2_/TRDRNA2_177381_c3_seq2.p1 gnl/TRDRNA2_/TRDRNA2_177381_c3~~gnl/TRDRNA2_/TRDRNA2_177381_c3_seq2.p1  ORF type:complete len:119 (-),score=20.47 gnl/TRDRNA2_/TRDRNA2_177381_c3_seq2:153-509(-)